MKYKQLDMALVNGEVITMDDSSPRAEAVGVRDDKIVAVGESAEIRKMMTKETKLIDLKGRTVVPGFFDSHTHALLWGWFRGARGDGWADLSGANSISDIVDKIAEVARTTSKGRWIRGFGYLDWRLKENRQPTRWELDKAAPDHLVDITPCGGHVTVHNSKALNLAGITKDTPDPPGGQILKDPETKEPNGILLDTASDLIWSLMPSPSIDIVKQRAKEQFELLARHGVTSYMDAGFSIGEMLSSGIRTYQELYSSGEQPVRAYISLIVWSRIRPKDERSLGSIILDEPVEKMMLPLTGFGNDWLKIGPIKIISDGAEDSRTAALIEPYAGEPENRGNLVYDQETLSKLVAKLHKAGYQLAIHACGDKANEMVVTALETALREYPRPNHRHRIEHCAIVNEEILDRIQALGGVIASVDYPFIFQLGDGVMASTGKRSRYYCCGRSFLKRGIKIAGGSDYSYDMFFDDGIPAGSPLAGICYAVTRRTRDGKILAENEKLTVEEAIRAYTLDSAYAQFEEKIKGSIEVGKLADMVVLSDNPLKVLPEQIKRIKVDMTIVGGRIVYQHKGP